MKQFFRTAVVLGSLVFMAFVVPMAMIAHSATHSWTWVFGVPVMAMASLVLGGILAGNIGFDLDETEGVPTTVHKPTGDQPTSVAMRAARPRQVVPTLKKAA